MPSTCETPFDTEDSAAEDGAPVAAGRERHSCTGRTNRRDAGAGVRDAGCVDLLEKMTTFVRIVEAGSLAAAARQLRGSPAAVSRQLAAQMMGMDFHKQKAMRATA